MRDPSVWFIKVAAEVPGSDSGQLLWEIADGQCLVLDNVLLSYAPPLAQISPPVATSSLDLFSLPLFTRVTDAANGVRSRFSLQHHPTNRHGLQGSQPSDVRAHNRAANGACDEYKQLRCSPWEDKSS
ncbi:hypothetical protein ACLB1T_24500 [Escherichia coli]